MNFTELVEQKKKEARLANIAQVRNEIDSTDVANKIKNHIERFDGIFTYEEIKEGILTNNIIASKFCKDPGRQNISEKLAAEVLGIPRLPQSGRNVIRFTPTGEITYISSGNTKAADFKVGKYYATQKYTQEAGGAQDNQKADVISFLRAGAINYPVMAILDGAYWDIHRDNLKELFKDNNNIIITSIDEILENKEQGETYE